METRRIWQRIVIRPRDIIHSLSGLVRPELAVPGCNARGNERSIAATMALRKYFRSLRYDSAY
jgi:hypothetical protein